MSDTAPLRRVHYQWPCRMDAETHEKLLLIQKMTGDDKSGVIRLVIKLGIETWFRRDRNAHALERQGLSIDAILPYIGDGDGRRRARGETR